MSVVTKKKERMAFNKHVKAISDLYSVSYNEVMRIYKNQNESISATRVILNMRENILPAKDVMC